MSDSIAPRIEPGGLRELGLPGWLMCKVFARGSGVPEAHLFTTLGQHKRLFWTWLPFSGMLLGPGRLPRDDAELVILRVGHLRGSEYELQHHRRLAKRRGINAETQAMIFEGPDADGLSDRQRALVTATDEFVMTRSMSPQTWQWLSRHLDRRQLIEFCMLAGQYDALAATIATLKIPLDLPE
jgi:alkylhydroperoxidase family enzyme